MDHITAVPNETSFKIKIKNTPWFYHYQAAFELFLEKPVLGHGYKSFRTKCHETKIEKNLLKIKLIIKVTEPVHHIHITI